MVKKKELKHKTELCKTFSETGKVLMDLNVDFHMEKKNYQKKLYVIIMKKNM